MRLVLGMAKSMGCFASVTKANSQGLILVGVFCGVVTNCTPILMIANNVIMEILIQYFVHSFGLSIG